MVTPAPTTTPVLTLNLTPSPIRLRKNLLKGLFTLNAILVRFAVVPDFTRFLTRAVNENIFHTIQTQTVLLRTGCFEKHLTIVF